MAEKEERKIKQAKQNAAKFREKISEEMLIQDINPIPTQRETVGLEIQALAEGKEHITGSEKDFKALSKQIIEVKNEFLDKDINFRVKSCGEKGTTKVCVSLELENEGSRDLYISRDALLLDGFTSNKFTISGASHVKCLIPSVFYKPEMIVLEAGKTITSSLVLSDVCSFSEGEYQIQFDSYVHFCTDLKQNNCPASRSLSGNIEIKLPETFEL